MGQNNFMNRNPMSYDQNGYPMNSYRQSGQVQMYDPQYGAATSFRPAPTYTYPVMVGRVVNDLEDIRPNEVPNDGSVSVFPQQDRSCIYVKYLEGDGTIKTLRYVPEVVNAQDLPNSNNDLADVIRRLSNIERMLKKPRQYNKRKGPKPNMEVQDDVQPK